MNNYIYTRAHIVYGWGLGHVPAKDLISGALKKSHVGTVQHILCM